MTKFLKTLMAVAAFSLTATSVVAKPINIDTVGSVTNQSILKAGDYGWNDTDEQAGPVTIKVNLKTQMIYVNRGDMLIGIANISSGRDGFESPEGNFTILGKEDNHFSKKYKADMPFTMWVNNDGVALHSGSTPGRRTSHGCIHLPGEFAKLLYGVTDTGVSVTITNQSTTSLSSLF